MSESDSEQLEKKFPSFLEFLNEGRRKGSYKWDPEDGKFIDDIWKDRAARQASLDMNGKIKAARKHLVKKIQLAGANPSSSKLSDLYKQAQDLGLKDIEVAFRRGRPPSGKVKPRRVNPGQGKQWQKFERDVATGIQNLLDSGFFLLTREGGEARKPLVGDPSFKAEVAGGGLESDVRVSHGDRKFYVECKLDYETSRYFKYNLELVDGKLMYNHQRYLQGKTPEERKKIDHLFKHGIRLNEILDEILADGDIEKKAREFFMHLDLLAKSIKESEEFRLFSKHIQLGRRYPEGFSQCAQVFDEYLQHYSSRYNQIIDQMFECLVDDPVLQGTKESFKLGVKNANASDAVSDLAATLLDQEDGERIFKSENSMSKFIELGKILKTIEDKFNAILAALKKPHRQFNILFELPHKQKLMYFFKAFLSSTRDSRRVDPTAIEDFENAMISPELASGELESDELGTMQICGGIVESEKIARKIAMFYALKDKCAYMQIGDTIFSLDPDFDPLQLEWIPSFSESVTQFDVRVTLSDDLSEIRLRMRGLAPQNLEGDLLSFIQSDQNYVAKKMKSIEIEISK